MPSKEDVVQSLNEFFSDKSRSIKETYDALLEIRSEIDIQLGALSEDLDGADDSIETALDEADAEDQADAMDLPEDIDL